jgi:hypothetical protein
MGSDPSRRCASTHAEESASAFLYDSANYAGWNAGIYNISSLNLRSQIDGETGAF